MGDDARAKPELASEEDGSSDARRAKHRRVSRSEAESETSALNGDDSEAPDTAEVRLAQSALRHLAALHEVDRSVVLHALLASSGNVHLAHKLLTLGHDCVRQQRIDEYFSYADDCALRDGTLADRPVTALKARWQYLELPMESFPFSDVES